MQRWIAIAALMGFMATGISLGIDPGPGARFEPRKKPKKVERTVKTNDEVITGIKP